VDKISQATARQITYDSVGERGKIAVFNVALLGLLMRLLWMQAAAQVKCSFFGADPQLNMP
jgi:hypothetical protein